jgi:hypothetical protein
MYGVWLVILLEGINSMLALLMISASSHGSIFLSTNLKSSKSLKNSRALLNSCLTRKFLPSRPTRVVTIKKLHPFFKEVGISHHISCPYAPQQNGPVERKHRHIVEVGLSLLAHASMPLKYWDEAFLGVTYLINRLPTKVLDFSTPLESCSKKSRTMLGYARLVVRAGPTFALSTHTNSNSVPNSVFS